MEGERVLYVLIVVLSHLTVALNLYWFLNERPPRFLHLAGKHDYARQNRAQGDTKVSNTEINRKALWITIAVLLGLLVCRLSVDFVFGAGASSVPEMPEVTFLGEGPGTFNNESGDFVVKARPLDMVLREGPEYQAKKNERVWAVEEGTTRPVHINDDEWTISVFDKAGCTVGYTIIDDDVDERMSGFYLNGQLLHAVPQGMVSYGVLEVPEEGILTFRTEDSIGLWADYECPGQPVEFKAYLPLAIGQPLPPPPPAVCERETLSASMAGQNATLDFQPWPGAEYDFGIWGPGVPLSLTASRDVDWAVSRAADQYHYLPVAKTYSLTGVYPWPDTGSEIWDSNPIELLAIPDYHIRMWYQDTSGVRCEVSGWVQWDPPAEEIRMVEQSAKPADLRPVDWK